MTYVYVGAGAWLHGVPARDLTTDEWESLDADLRATALARGLYEPVDADAPIDSGEE